MSKTTRKTIKVKDMPVYTMSPLALRCSVDRDKGIPIETRFNGVRMFIIQDNLLILDDTNGGALSIELNNINELVGELMDIEEMYGRMQ